MPDPFRDDHEWAWRMDFLSRLLDLPVQDQLDVMLQAVKHVYMMRTDLLQSLLWRAELTERYWLMIDVQPDIMRIIG